MGQFINSGRQAGSRPGLRRAGGGSLGRQLRPQESVEGVLYWEGPAVAASGREGHTTTSTPDRSPARRPARFAAGDAAPVPESRRLSRGHDARRPDGEELLLARGGHPGQRARHPGQAPHRRRAAEVVQANHGETASRPDQREPGAAEDAHPGRPQEGQLQALQAGEGRYLGNDGEALAQPAAGPDDRRAQHGPLRLVQVPSRFQRVHDRGDSLPLLLRGREHGGPEPAAWTPGRLPESDQRPELPRPAVCSAAPDARRPARSLFGAASGTDARRHGAPFWQRGSLQTRQSRGRERQGVRRLPAGAGF